MMGKYCPWSGWGPTIAGTSDLFQFMHVIQDAAGHADREDGEVAFGLVPHTARNVDDDAGVKFDLLVVEDHASLAADHVVKLVRSLVVMQLGIMDFDVMHFAGRAVLLFN
jgi:hypothetical protein